MSRRHKWSAAERRRAVMAGSLIHQMPPKPHKIAKIEVWRRQVVNTFRSHDWMEASADRMDCKKCGAMVWHRAPEGSGARTTFKIVVNEWEMGWTDKKIENCDEMIVMDVQEK